jgi:tetratricopeptide (TPR) repeat protein
MEFVEGGTLKQWLRARPRTRHEVLSVFVQAGRGLQSAHEAGLVHRDFKPDNVLVSTKGHAQVLDFGLAKATEDGERALVDERPTEALHSLNSHLTQVGAILGTPAYMAPEQHLGEPTDARTDQFSFCVALYEALYGNPPFYGDNLMSLANAVLSGKVAEAPRESYARVPPWLRRILLKGLSVHPADRYSTMAALLDDLGRDPSSQRRRWLLALGAGAAVAVGAAGWAQLRAESDALCDSAHSQLEGVWDGARKAQVQAAFAHGGDPAFTAETFRRVEAALDRHAATWATAQTEACHAAQTGAAGDELVHLQAACLARRFAELRAVVDVLARADRKTVERAVDVVAGLGDVAVCSEEQVLTTSIVPPASAAARAAVSALRARLDAARAEARSGQYASGLARVRAAVVEARALGYAPALAEALVALGDLENLSGRARAAEDAYAEAIRTAAAGRHPRAAAEAWVQLVESVGVAQAQAERALGLRLAAEAALAWDGADPVLSARFMTTLARVHQTLGDYGEATALANRALQQLGARDGGDVLRKLERARVATALGRAAYARGELDAAEQRYRDALALRREALGPDHPEVATSLNDLGSTDYARGRYAEARLTLEQALALRTRVLGPDHPEVSDTETGLGAIFYATGDYRASRDHYARAAAIRGAAFGPDHPKTAGALMNLGNAELALGDLERAAEHYEAARAIQEKTLGPEHPELAYSLTNLGLVLRNQDRLAESIRYYERALRIREKTLAPGDPTIGHNLELLGDAMAAAGFLPQALDALGRALSIREKALGPDHPDTASTLLSLGEATAKAGRPKDALPLLRRAVEILERALGSTHPDVATALVSLVRVELDTDAPGAAGHAERALGIRMADAGATQPDRAEAQFLLARALVSRERARALPLATLARATYALTESENQASIAEIDAWLKRQGSK